MDSANYQQPQADAFPIGTLVYYGPDDQTVTKITASVIPYLEAEPIQRTWEGEDVTIDPQAIAEIGGFFRSQGVKKVVMPDRVIGCPHVEGVDYPAGEKCPYCPYWANKTEQPGQ